MSNVSTVLIERAHGVEFTARIQDVLTALSLWRQRIIIEMTREGVDEIELDTLHHEMIECGMAIQAMAASGERMKKAREGEPWPE
jgi:hypothetical protein